MKIRLLVMGAALAGASLVGGALLLPTAADPQPQANPSIRPDDAATWAQRGLASIQNARDEADPRHLTEADAALRTSLRIQPDGNVAAFVGRAALANARHDFSRSVVWSRRAIAANPHNASAYGLLGDALFELGRVRQSEVAYQDMVDLRPDTASYIRASYAQQHQGAVQQAIRSLRLAARAAGPTGPSAAFVQHQLGDVFAGQGRWALVERVNRRGIALAPGFVPPTVGLAESYLARGRIGEAIPLLEDAVEGLPSIEYLITLGDAYSAVGRSEDAGAMFDRVAGLLATYRKHGVKPDADFIVFYADHGNRPDAALREAFEIYANRPTPKVADALAWMLHAVGRSEDAQQYAREAIRGGDASAMFRAAQIERALGAEDRAARLLRRALTIDPAFSVVDAPIARHQLEEMS